VFESNGGTGAKRLLKTGAVALICLVALSGTAHASTVLLNDVFNGAAPGGSGPWLTADFQTISPGTVRLTLAANLSATAEFIDDVTFNVNPAIAPFTVTVTQISGKAASSILHTTSDSRSLQGSGAAGTGFDFSIEWPTSGRNGGALRFQGNDVAVFSLTLNGITAADFNTFTNTGSANATVGAHVLGIPQAGGGTTSGAIENGSLSSVPEPASAALIVGGALVLVALQRRVKQVR
jgi:hypothetical protein